MKNLTSYIALLSICLIAALCRISVFNTDVQGIHLWRQSQTMWNVRNFIRHDSNILNPRTSHFNGDDSNIQRYEFPLMQWTLAKLQVIFGEKVLVFRIYMFLIGCFGIWAFFLLMGLVHDNKQISFFTTFSFTFSPLFYYYSLNPLPDLLAFVLALWYVYFHLLYIKKSTNTILILAVVFLCLSGLVKLPYLMYGIMSVLYLTYKTYKHGIDKQLLTYASLHAIILIPIYMWYSWVMPSWNGNGVLYGLFNNPAGVEKTNEILHYSLFTMFPQILMTLPMLILFVLGIFNQHQKSYKYKYLFLGVLCITMLYWILEYNMIDINHDYYLIPLLLWIYYFVSWGIEAFLRKTSYLRHTLLGLILITSAIVCHFTTIKNWSIERSFYKKELFVYKNEFVRSVPRDALCIMLNDNSNHIFSYLIDKRGYVFQNDNLPMHWIHDMVLRKGVKYMYSDSEIVNNDALKNGYIKRTILQRGSISVFELQLPNIQ